MFSPLPATNDRRKSGSESSGQTLPNKVKAQFASIAEVLDSHQRNQRRAPIDSQGSSSSKNTIIHEPRSGDAVKPALTKNPQPSTATAVPHSGPVEHKPIAKVRQVDILPEVSWERRYEAWSSGAYPAAPLPEHYK